MRRGTHTIVAKTLTAADAKSSYLEKRSDVDKMIARLKKALIKQDREFKKDETNWGFAGNMGHVYSELTDIVEFLGG